MDVRTWTNTPEDIDELYTRYVDFDLVVDSRLVARVGNTLFFALPGAQRDGISFVPELIEGGVRHFVVSSTDRLPELVGITYTLTPHPLKLLQQLVAHHRSRLSPRTVVGITGSNGKTIVKDWLVELLSLRFKVCATPRSFNSQIGVPLSVWKMREQHEIGVFEAGISEPGEMEILASIIQPTCGVLTNIGTAHLANFGSTDHLVAEKLKLFDRAEWVLAPGKYANEAERTGLSGQQIYTWLGSGRQGIELSGKSYPLQFPDLPAIYLDNARTTAACAILLGVLPDSEMQAALHDLHPLTNRLEQRAGRSGGVIINDSYSNDFSALAAALQFAERQDPFANVTLILGTVQDLPDLPQRILALLTDRVSTLLLVGKRNAGLSAFFPAATHYQNADELLARLDDIDFTDQTVLVKGASYEQFGRIADRLSLQRHRTILHVDLAALRHNLNTYRKLLPTDCKLLVMAKASAYGSGALPVARLLQGAGADHLAVAYPDEGRALRRGGIDLPILVLNAELQTLQDLVEHCLEPAVHSIAQFRVADRLGLKMHLEIDTGMGRLGFSPAEFLTHLRELTSPNVRAIFTHLAASEDAAHDGFSRQQIATFDRLYEQYTLGGGAPVQRHVLNSNGIGRFPQARYELVRLGIGLYGIGDAECSAQLQPALSLQASISSIREVSEDQTIGYGRRGRVVKGSRIAVVSIGYADGLPRAAGEGKFSLLLHGKPVPTVGAICMDMCMVDVTTVPEARTGDSIIVFGSEHPIDLLSAAVGTIPYEILTGIGERVHRIYTGE